MARRKKGAQGAETTGATAGYEAELGRMADALQGSMDAADWRLAKMNLAIRGIDGQIEEGDTFFFDRFDSPQGDRP